MRSALLVAAGAAAGASMRWGLGGLIERSPDGFPWATLIVNLVGCLLAGVALRRLTRGSERWLTLVTGVLGGLTTFSAFSVETRALLDGGRAGMAFAYVAISVIGGVAAIEVGRAGGSST